MPDVRNTALFGPFALTPQRMLLLDNGTPVRLGGRALTLLCALVERAGDVLSRTELEAKVWPSTVVEETSLRVQIAALRKVLGDRQGGRYIVNVIGRGYSFVAPVTWQAAAPAEPDIEPDTGTARHNLPARLTRVLGRDDVVQALQAQLGRRRLLSIVGPGGIGKTSVALLVAEGAWQGFEHGVCFVDLAPVSDPQAVGSMLVAALAGAAAGADVMPTLRMALHGRRLLLVFDNCEHVVGAVAELCEALLRAAPELRILTTSREPLNVDGEWVHRLAALDTPEPTASLDLDAAMAYPALRLFVERAMASAETFAVSEANLPFIRQVCWRLDGMPLAIELAAARVGSLGAQTLAARLDDVFDLLQRRRPTGDPRHRALKAVLEWSHALLSADERGVLRRISVFRAAFTLEAAARVASDAQIDADAVVRHLLSLVDKSLVTVNAGSDIPQYRLLFATRKFAELELASFDETELLLGRHAQYFHDELVALRADPEMMGTASFLAFFEHTFDDTSAAIDWAFTRPQTMELGLQLALRCNLYDVGRLDPQMLRFERIARHVLQLTPPRHDWEMWVIHNVCRMSGMSNGFNLPQDTLFTALRRAIEDAQPQDRAVAIHSMSIGAFGQGRYRASMGLLEELAALVDQPMTAWQSERMRAVNLHFLGEQQRARAMAQTLSDEVVTSARAPFLQSARRAFPIRLVLARILWISGQVDQAAAAVELMLAESAEAYPFARCKALGLAAVPVALWRGELDLAEAANRQMRTLADRHSLGYWQSWADNFDRIIGARRRGEPVRIPLEGAPAHGLPRRNVTELDALPTFAGELLTEQAIARVAQGEVGWCAPETLRLQALRSLGQSGEEAEAEAEALLVRSLELARTQDALSWELRTACSLSQLWHRQGRSHDAHNLLGPVLSSFVEGRHTPDVVAARQLLTEFERR